MQTSLETLIKYGMHYKRILRCASWLTLCPDRPIIRNTRPGGTTLRLAWLVSQVTVTNCDLPLSLSFYLTTFSFKQQVDLPWAWGGGMRVRSGTLRLGGRSLVHHLLGRFLESASSFVVQLLLLGYRCRAVWLAHLLRPRSLVRVITFTVVGGIHHGCAGRFLFGRTIRCNLLLGSTLNKRQEMVLSANWFELTFEKRAKIWELRISKVRTRYSIIISSYLVATYFFLLCLWRSCLRWFFSVNNVQHTVL